MMFPDLGFDLAEEHPRDEVEEAALALATSIGAPRDATPAVPSATLVALQQGESLPSSSLLPHVAAVWRQISTDGPLSLQSSQQEPTIPKLSNFFLRTTSRLHTSKEVLGQLLSIDPNKVEGNLAAIASSLILCDQADKQSLEVLLARSQAECLMYLELNKYDETPTLLTVKQPLAPHTAGQPPPAPTAAASSSATPSTGLVGEVATVTKQATKTKLFATEQGFAMLLKLPDAVTEHLPQYLVLMGKSLSCLQALERTTASSLHQALQAGSVTNNGNLGFRLHCRVTTTDAASENFVAERLVMAQRDEAWSSIHMVCLVHQIAIAHSRTFSLMQSHISGMVNLSLVLATGSAMSTFRDHLSATVRQRLRILRGYPPEEATAYRKFILDLFCSTGRHRELRRFLLQALPNGEWRNSDAIEVYVPPEMDCDEEQLTGSVINGLVIALSGKVFSTYPQSRWIGCDIAVDEVGLCEAVHRLLFLSLSRMYGQAVELSTTEPAQADALTGYPLEPATAGTASAAHATPPMLPWHHTGVGP